MEKISGTEQQLAPLKVTLRERREMEDAVHKSLHYFKTVSVWLMLIQLLAVLMLAAFQDLQRFGISSVSGSLAFHFQDL